MKNWLVAAGIISSLSVNAQDSRKIDFVEYDLDNGMHVILHEDHSTPIAAVTIFLLKPFS